MGNMLYNISQVLGLTIIHSLWQGLLIYFVLRMVLLFPGQLSSSKKYLLALSSLFAITAWFFYTLIKQVYLFDWLAAVPAKTPGAPLLLTLPAGVHQFNDDSIRYYYSIEGFLPYITAVYIIGLMFSVGRIIAANKKTAFIRRNASFSSELQQQVNKFAAKLGISKKIQIGLSKLVNVPCMTGYLKPMILLPFTLQTYLSANEIEAIILHELAHIKRNDYLLNILQQVIAILLFFNPCAQLINKLINEEREKACDDLVVKAEAEPIVYAKALLKLAQYSQNDRKLALAATGKKYHLLNRIERIMKSKNTKSSARPALLAMLIFTVSMGAVALLNPQIAQGKISVKAMRPVIEQLLADTTHKQAVKTHAVVKTKHAVKHNTKVDDKTFDELNADIQKYSDAVSKYYSSAAFKQIQDELAQKGDAMQQFYDQPEIKQLQAELEQVSKNTQNWTGDSKLAAISAELGEKGRKIGEYYSSPEFKKLNSALKKKYGIKVDQEYFDDERDENYKNYQAELKSRIPADVRLQQDDLEKLGKQMGDHYSSPEFAANSKRMHKISDSLSVLYQNPQLKEQQAAIQELSKQMKSYTNNPDLRKQQELLNQYVKKLTAYITSAEYKKYLKQAMDFKFDYNYDYKNDTDTTKNNVNEDKSNNDN